MNNVNFSEENWFFRQRNEEEEENWMFLIFEDFLTDKYCIFLAFVLAKVVQKLDSAIHRINHYPADTYYGKQLRYTLDSDLSAG